MAGTSDGMEQEVRAALQEILPVQHAGPSVVLADVIDHPVGRLS